MEIGELRVIGEYPTFSWQEGKSEIEFIVKTTNGEILPLEVKSGKRTKAKSLKIYKNKYTPVKTIKLIGAAGGNNEQDILWPLYHTHFLPKL